MSRKNNTMGRKNIITTTFTKDELSDYRFSIIVIKPTYSDEVRNKLIEHSKKYNVAIYEDGVLYDV
jgi:hypothetical protein